MGLRMWLFDVEMNEKNDLKSQTNTEGKLNELTITSINEKRDTVASEQRHKKDNLIEIVLNLFDGEVVGFTGLLKELFEERAAIMEYDGGLLRKQAESTAIKTVLKHSKYS